MADIAIIGGGIGGLTMANCLQAKGIDFRLYEQAPQLGEVGAGIGLSKSVMDLFRQIGLYGELEASGSFIKYACMTSKNLEVRRELPVELDSICIHRAKLIDILSKRIDKGKIHLNKKVSKTSQNANGTTVFFSDGTSTQCDSVIVADGIHSPIRKQLFPNLNIRYANQIIWRGVTKINLDAFYQNRFIESWDEYKRFLFVPLNKEHVFWLAVRNGAPGSEKSTKADLLKEYSTFHPLMQQLIRDSENLIQNDLADLGGDDRIWHQENVVFIGDAIHATTPNLAQGGCQAIEDAFALTRMLIKHNFNHNLAFPAYQQLRNKKAMYVVNTSWKIGQMAHQGSKLKYFLSKQAWRFIPDGMLKKSERFINDISYLA